MRSRVASPATARNLSFVLRHLVGIGTARSLQGEGGLADDLYLVLFNARTVLERLLTPKPRSDRQKSATSGSS